MARMLAKAREDSGGMVCPYGCCRNRVFYAHGGRHNSKVRKAQRVKEKKAWQKIEND